MKFFLCLISRLVKGDLANGVEAEQKKASGDFVISFGS